MAGAALQHGCLPAPGVQQLGKRQHLTNQLPSLRLAHNKPFGGSAASAKLEGRAHRSRLTCSASSSDGEPSSATPLEAGEDEEVYYEGSGAVGELVLSVLLGATLIYLPLTLASVGRRLWITYKFTNKRLVVTTSSPVFKRDVQVSYDKIKEVRTVPRGFGLWGDMVVFLKDGSRLEIVGLERHLELQKYMEARMSA